MKRILLVTCFFAFTSAKASNITAVHCPLGCPTSPAKNAQVYGHLYALSNNAETKFADWVAYEVDVVNFGESPGRDWSADPLLKDTETLEELDYKDSSKPPLNADRGHQAPLAHFAGNRYWYELNYLSNITPQDKDLNQGPWKALEDAERKAVVYREPLFVITGTLYEKSMPSMPGADEPHKVPSGYFKVVYDLKGNAAAFAMEQSTGRDESYCAKMIPLVELDKRLGFKLPTLKHSQAISKRLGC